MKQVYLVLDSPAAAFCILFLITYLFCIRFINEDYPTLASGNIILALSTFALFCLRPLGLPYFFMLYVALEILVILIYLGINFLHGVFENDIEIKEITQDLSLGTWVVSMVMTILLLNQIEKTLLGFIALLSIVAISLFCYYAYIIFKWYAFYFQRKNGLQVNGMLLMSVVSVQAIVILLHDLFKDNIPDEVYLFLISLGMVLYLLGFACILLYLWRSRSQFMILGWSNEYNINHAALSITGLALTQLGRFSQNALELFWYVVTLIFILSAIVELARFLKRLKYKKGARLPVYYITQWIRIFAYAVFYGFNFAILASAYEPLTSVRLIVSYGQYIVTILLLFQFYLYFKHVKGVSQ